jgi:ribosomal protein L9
VLALEGKRVAEKARQDALLEKALAGVKDAVITLKRAANEEGHLYAGVTKDDLATELGKMIGAALEAQHIDLEKPLKALGEFTVSAMVGEKNAAFKVIIEAE